MKRIFVAVCVLSTVAASPAAAQVPADTSWGGGELAPKPPGRGFPGRAGDANVSVRTSADGTAVTSGAAVLFARRGGTCQTIGFGTVPINPDGTFSITDRRTMRGTRERTVVTITGRIEGSRVTGEVAGSMRSRRGRPICSGRTTFTSIAVPPLPADQPAPPPAGGTLRGIVEGEAAAPFDIVMRLTPDGRAIERLNMTTPWRCGPGYGDLVFYETGGPIRADGTFRIVNRYRFRNRGTILRGAVTIAGRFVSGGVVGTVRATSVLRSRKGRRRVIGRCSSGTRAFRAAI